MKVAIAGPPRAGKTTFALELARKTGQLLESTDRFKELSWSYQSTAAAMLFNADGDQIIEGVTTPRAMRKWMAANPTGRPVDTVYWLGTPREQLSPGQNTMAKGIDKVMAEIVPELKERGVTIVSVGHDGTQYTM